MISIIVPVYNQHEMTTECIDAVRARTQDYEIIVVDNGSTPWFHYGSPEYYVGREQEWIRIIRNETNLGFPVAVNQGIRAAKGDIIVLLNNDVIVTPGWAAALVRHLDQVAIVSPMTNYCAGMQRVTLPAYRDGDELDARAREWARKNAGQSVPVNWVIGFCMAFRRSLYDELGEFDESLWPCSGEEIDFCMRARQAGHDIGIAQDVYVHHFGSQTFGDMARAGQLNYNEIVDRNDKHLSEKWGNVWAKQKQ